jgi:hypothetical protein
MSQQTFFHVLIGLLEQAGICYMVTGSYGSSHYGMPRTTNDLDLVVDPTVAQVQSLCALVANRFYVSAPAAVEAVQNRFMFNIIDVAGGCKADLMVRKNRPFSVEEFSRRSSLSIAGDVVFVASPEDIILSKLEWNKLTPSERQVQDALDVAIVQWPHLDLDYLRRWATDLEVSESLEAVLLQAGQANQHI